LEKDEPSAARCYCHGDRDEEAHEITQDNAAEVGCEYAYAFETTPEEGDVMLLLSSYVREQAEDSRGERSTKGRKGKKHKMIGMFGQGDPAAVWETIARIPLNGPAPDWERLQRQALGE
jgi:hypothetical protein